MRKFLVAFMFLMLCLGFSIMPAHAQTTITLNAGTCLNCYKFTVTSTTTLNQITPLVVAGGASSIGSLSPSPIPSTLNLVLANLSPIVFTYGGSGHYTYSSGAPIAVSLSVGTFILTGELFIQTLDQLGNFGFINDNISGNFAIATSTCPAASACGVGKIGYGYINLLLGGVPHQPILNGTLASFAGGAITLPAPGVTPEPASLLLFGSGLLVIGGVLRRRMVVSA